MKSASEHWDSVFTSCEDADLGWYEGDVSRTMGLLEQVPEWRKSIIFLPGAGTSLLIEELLSQGAGLPVHRYSVEELTQRLGPGFRLVSHFDYTYINPSGTPRPYIYALYKKEEGV